MSLGERMRWGVLYALVVFELALILLLCGALTRIRL